MFSEELIGQISAEATAAGIEAAAMLAMVEVETSGRPYETDGRTPTFRFEPHICFAQASKVSPTVLAKFVAAGLAWPKANTKAASALQNTSSRRLELIKRARAIHEEVALSSTSWGLGQVMGFNARAMGFESASQMVILMTDGGVLAQIRIMIKMIETMGLVEKLNTHQFTAVARKWNGPDFASNAYDIKLKASRQRWSRKLVAPAKPIAPEALLSRAEIETIQGQLLSLNYTEVGTVDGRWGGRALGAISAFQEFEGIPRTGHYDEATREALAIAGPRPVDEKRSQTTAADLREKGSRTIAAADKLSWYGKLKMWIFGGGAVGATAEQGGLLDHAQEFSGKVSVARDLWDSVHGLVQPLLTPQFLILCIVGLALGYGVHRLAKCIAKYRTEDHNTGLHAGVSS